MMDEQEVAGLYIAEMHALMPIIQRHLDTLGSATSEEQCHIAAEELTRLGSAIADLSAGFHAEDCAQAALVLADCFAGTYFPFFRSAALLANCTDLLTYLKDRLATMTAHRRVLAPTDAERMTIARLVFTLQQTHKQLAAAESSKVIEQFPSLAELAAMSAVASDEPAVEVQDTTTDLLWTSMADNFATSSETIERSADPSLTVSEVGSHLTQEERELLRTFQTSVMRPNPRHSLPVSPVAPAASDNEHDAATTFSTHTTAEQDAATAATLTLSANEKMEIDSRKPAFLPMPRAVTAEELDYIPPEMKRLFVVETGEDVQAIRRMILDFEQHPNEWTTLSEMGRLAHKIKGAASTLGFDVLASLSLLFEDVLRAFQLRIVPAEPTAIATLTAMLALIEAALGAASAEQEPESTLIERAQQKYDSLLTTYNANTRDTTSEQLPSRGKSSGSLVVIDADNESDASAVRLRVGEADSMLRVEVHRLDELMNHVNALALNRASFIQMRDDILKLQSELDQALNRLGVVSRRVADSSPQQLSGSLPASISHQRHSLFGNRPAPSNAAQPYWDELEMERISEFDQAVRQLNEVVDDTTSTSKYLRLALTRLGQIGDEQATIAHDIQRDVMQIRLVRLEDLMPRIHLEARRLAAILGKAISFTVRGQMTEIDRNISEALAEPLLQLVRNAIVHGIEPPEERIEHGKLETGSIWIHAYYVGSEVVIEVGDDGQGVNPYRLAASAITIGLLDAESARRMNESDALDLMFKPGITGFPEVQMVAGRGIGLDEVRTTIQRLKGSIQVRSEPGKGSIFRIHVPISLSIVRTLSVHVAGQSYAVPFSSVLLMVGVTPGDLRSTTAVSSEQNGTNATRALHQQNLRVRMGIQPDLLNTKAEAQPQSSSPSLSGDNILYEEIPALSLADLLGFESTPSATQLALLVEVGHRRIALLVDRVSEDQEVVIQALPVHLRRRAIRGATVTPDGIVQLLLDLPELVQRALDESQSAVPIHKRPLPQHQASTAPRVLVVDDSVSIRGAVEHTLTRAGFEVQMARDGIEALEMMLVSPPQVMVLDIEMPRLDGFEVLAVMRDTPQFADIRVVMLTSRAADKHYEQAMKLGASAYLIKPCPQETLIETVRAQLHDRAAIS